MLPLKHLFVTTLPSVLLIKRPRVTQSFHKNEAVMNSLSSVLNKLRNKFHFFDTLVLFKEGLTCISKSVLFILGKS